MLQKTITGYGLAAALFCALTLSVSVWAQTYRSGQHIEPAFEGWRPNADGTFSFMFGYMNENWEQTIDIPVGENNMLSPGQADRGQPTHFLPRRNRFTFEVMVPADWGDRELVWTLNSPNGEQRRAYATLAPDYIVDSVVIASETGSLGAGTSSPESRANIKPDIEVLGDEIRVARVGEPLELLTRVEDDGIPRTRVKSPRSEEELRERMMDRPVRVTVDKINGLFLSWNKYRGEGNVSFDPPLPKPWEDTRVAANSPWSELWVPPPMPEDGIYRVHATFDEPGVYVLWARADDGGLYNDSYITVRVTE
ncbi:MAG: hypothetical protein ACR2PR_02055 [Pseudohongiellaceae bacterium]